MQAIGSYFSRHTNGNSAWAWNKYRPYLTALDTSQGITKAELRGLFEASMLRQFAA